MSLFEKRIAIMFAGLFAFVACAGCSSSSGPDMVSVSGAVTMDGQPLADADVVFSPAGDTPAASGKTDGQGNFELQAVPGSYQIAVTKTEGGKIEGMPDTSGMSDEEATKKAMQAFYTSDAGKKQGARKPAAGPKELVPVKYTNPKESGLTAEVKAEGTNNFKFDLQGGGAAPAAG